MAGSTSCAFQGRAMRLVWPTGIPRRGHRAFRNGAWRSRLAAFRVLARLAAGTPRPSASCTAGQRWMTEKQSRTMSLVETVTNVVVGFLLALATQIAIFTVFGLVVSFSDNFLIGILFTA